MNKKVAILFAFIAALIGAAYAQVHRRQGLRDGRDA